LKLRIRVGAYAIVGAGARAYLYLRALTGEHAASGQLVGVCDPNPGRRARAARTAGARGVWIAQFGAADFKRMLIETEAECVIVTTPDFTHADYIVGALEAGVDVVTEKPLTVDAESCRRIIAARQATGRSVRVAFNYRYSPSRTLVKQVLLSGIIGAVTAAAPSTARRRRTRWASLIAASRLPRVRRLQAQAGSRGQPFARGPLCRQRTPRRLFPRPLRFQRRHRYRRHPAGADRL
jgi:predicted dehydrogenase